VSPGEKADDGCEEKTEGRPSGNPDAANEKSPFRAACLSGHRVESFLWNNGHIMNVFLVILSSIIFLASFPMFTYAFVVPEQFAIALFTGGVLTASLAFAIPLWFLSKTDR
jgi:hypothetical protein